MIISTNYTGIHDLKSPCLFILFRFAAIQRLIWDASASVREQADPVPSWKKLIVSKPSIPHRIQYRTYEESVVLFERRQTWLTWPRGSH